MSCRLSLRHRSDRHETGASELREEHAFGVLDLEWLWCLRPSHAKWKRALVIDSGFKHCTISLAWQQQRVKPHLNADSSGEVTRQHERIRSGYRRSPARFSSSVHPSWRDQSVSLFDAWRLLMGSIDASPQLSRCPQDSLHGPSRFLSLGNESPQPGQKVPHSNEGHIMDLAHVVRVIA